MGYTKVKLAIARDSDQHPSNVLTERLSLLAIVSAAAAVVIRLGSPSKFLRDLAFVIKGSSVMIYACLN